METAAVYEKLVYRMFEDDPVKAARQLETTDSAESAVLIRNLPFHVSSGIIRHMSDTDVASIFTHLSVNEMFPVVDGLDSERIANMLVSFPKETRKEILDRLEKKKKQEVRELLTFPVDSAGRIMSKDIITLNKDLPVREAVRRIRELARQKKSQHFYVYVIDDEGVFSGVLNMRDLLLASEEDLLESIMRKNPFSVDAFMDREQVAEELSARKYFAAPVVDAQGKILGVVKTDKIISGVQEEAAEDIMRMFGAGGNERAFSPLLFSLKTRLPWLHVNLLTAFMAASVVAFFEDIIAKITVLAVFLPVVAGQGGNAGAQALAVVMRGLVMREIPANKVRQILIKETTLGLINGVVIGTVTAVCAWLWNGNPYLGVVIGLGMIVNLTAAGFAGAIIPVSMKKLGLDPAQCSSIILTTITDITGFMAFLGFAVMFQKFLI